MMFLLLLTSFFMSFFIGYFIINGLWFRQKSILCGFALKMFLSLGAGIGVSSLGFFITILLVTPSKNVVIFSDIVMFLLSLTFFVLSVKLRRREPCCEIKNDTVCGSTTIMKLVSLMLLFMIGFF
tara:strand:+ start:424 stop:798 length:375 start_codon:yes stop_codon:yes gene_type:complete